jgi:hypothetical protein
VASSSRCSRRTTTIASRSILRRRCPLALARTPASTAADPRPRRQGGRPRSEGASRLHATTPACCRRAHARQHFAASRDGDLVQARRLKRQLRVARSIIGRSSRVGGSMRLSPCSWADSESSGACGCRGGRQWRIVLARPAKQPHLQKGHGGPTCCSAAEYRSTRRLVGQHVGRPVGS